MLTLEMTGGVFSGKNREGQKLTSHVGEFLAASFEVITIFGLHCILDSTGDGVVDAQNRALNQFHLPGGISTEVALGCLSLAPSLCGGGFASSVGGRDTTGNTKPGSWIFHCVARIQGTAHIMRILILWIGRVRFS